MILNVHIKDKKYRINCGDSSQSLEYEDEIKARAAEPKIFRLESAHFVEMRGKVCDIFHEDQNIWVILEDEYNPHG